MLFGIPRSPRWLVRKGRVAEARTVLAHDRRGEHRGANCRTSSRPSTLDHGTGQRAAVPARSIRLPIFLAISIGMFNQLSGINAILYYLNDIFAKAGFSKVSGDLQAVAIGATNLLFTMIAMSRHRQASGARRCC